MNTLETIERLKIFLYKQIDSLSLTNPIISFSKPLITRAINNRLNKADYLLNMIADEKGDIDVQTLIPEMIQSVMNTKPFIFHTEFLGDFEVGGGLIKMHIPMTNNQLVFGKADLDMLKETFIDRVGYE